MNRTLLLEIGVEEIPSKPLTDAVRQLSTDAEKLFADLRLGHEGVESFGAPRRIVLRVKGVAPLQTDQVVEIKGPAARAAYEADGTPTKAAYGFAASKGVDVKNLVRRTGADGEYVWAIIEEKGRSAKDVLPAALQTLISGLDWPKTQRWGSSEVRFIRPVRWILALLGAEVIPLEFGVLKAGRLTQGHRFLSPERSITVRSADDYDSAAVEGFFIYDAKRRARIISDFIDAFDRDKARRVVVPEKTFAEVTNLVEWPSVAVGTFDSKFLQVPREVLETAMTKHQRYFPVQDDTGGLANLFIVVHNGNASVEPQIVAGHERVIRARLADAAFFYREDLQDRLEDWVARLADIVFHEKLGGVGDKIGRVEALTDRLARLHGADVAEQRVARRAARLAKADLVSRVVVEFPDLQGVMGYHYAILQGEGEGVATAIREHYQPRFAGDAVPSTEAGLLVSAADKLDTLAGIFAIGQAPTGSADPYALRRSTIGFLTMVLDGGLRLTVSEAVSGALNGYVDMFPDILEGQIQSHITDFVQGRLETMLRDRGHAWDTVAAVLPVAGDDPMDALLRCKALSRARSEVPQAFENLSVAYTRALNLSSPLLGTAWDRSMMGPQEAVLADAMMNVELQAADAFESREYQTVLELLASLRQPIDRFFDEVLVMDPDQALRDNRLRLLNHFASLFTRFADLSKLTS